MKTTSRLLVIAAVLCASLLATPSRACAIDWIKDYEKALDEARERGAPLFIFYCQNG